MKYFLMLLLSGVLLVSCSKNKTCTECVNCNTYGDGEDCVYNGDPDTGSEFWESVRVADGCTCTTEER